jgi:hypothetical protein
MAAPFDYSLWGIVNGVVNYLGLKSGSLDYDDPTFRLALGLLKDASR